MKILGLVVLGFIGLFGIGWVVTGNSLLSYQFFAPKFEAARRQVYQETPSYLNGNRQNLLNQLAAYRSTLDPDAKAAILGGLRAEVSGLPEGFEVPPEVRQVLNGN